MQYRRLGRTELEVSELGFGAWHIGWTPPEEGDDVGRLLNRALDAGSILSILQRHIAGARN